MSGEPTVSKHRLKLFRNGTSTPGKVISIPESFEHLLQTANESFATEDITCVYLNDGSLVSSINLLRDDDTIFAATTDEPFSGGTGDDSPRDGGSGSRVGDAGGGDGRGQFSGQCSEADSSMSDWITLNVGGKCFTTTRNTLVKHPDSMLAREWYSFTLLFPSNLVSL